MFSTESVFDENTFLLQKLCRKHNSLVSNTAQYKNKVNSLFNLVFPKFNEAFSDVFSSVPLTICAITNKLINHFFVILRDKKAFKLRLRETRKKLYLERHLQIVI